MTSHDLYALYASAYAESSHFESRRLPGAPVRLARTLRRLLSAERAIEELARHDATDGRPMRTRTEFENALRHGRQVLAGLDGALGAGT